MGKNYDQYLAKKQELDLKMLYFRSEGVYGYPQMSDSDIAEIKELQNEVWILLDNTLKVEADAEKDIPREELILSQKTLGDDIKAFGYARKDMYLPDLYNEQKTISFQVSDQVFDKVGGQMSQRQRVTIPGPDGNLETGYFTEKSVLDRLENIKLLTQKFSQKYPKMAGIFEAYAKEFYNNYGKVNPKTKEPYINDMNKDDDLWNKQAFGEVFVLDQAREFKESLHAAEKQITVYKNNINDHSKGRIDSRNVAMKNVADMLGVGHLIPETFKINIVRGNQVIEGSFMKEVKGSNFNDRNKENSGLENLQKNSFDNPKVLKQLTDLAVLDYICGNVDRHSGNIMFTFDPKDPSKVTGIQGIDNDLSFGKGSTWTWSEAKTSLKGIMFMSASMYKSLKNMNEQLLNNCFDGMELDPDTATQMQERINNVLDKVKKTDPEKKYNGITILEDKDFEGKTLHDMTNLDVLRAASKKPKMSYKGLFNVIEGAKDNAIEVVQKIKSGEQKAEPSTKLRDAKPLNIFSGMTADFLNTDITYLNKLEDNVELAQKNVHGGSPQYDAAQKALSILVEKTKQKGLKGQLTSADDLRDLNSVYKDTIEKIDAYMQRKGNITKYKEGSKPYRRIQAMQEVRNFCTSKTRLLEKTINKVETMEMRNERDKLLKEQMNSLSKEDLTKVLTQIVKDGKTSPGSQIKSYELMRAMGTFDKNSNMNVEKLGLPDELKSDLKQLYSDGFNASVKEIQNKKQTEPQSVAKEKKDDFVIGMH